MKRDKQKLEKIKECIRKFYTTYSDRKMAVKFGVSIRAIATQRQRMGLIKTADISDKLRKGVKKIKRIGNSNERISY